jgi:hypothetical protein
MDNQRTATSSMRKAGLHHKCIFMAQSATCALVRRLSWRTHNEPHTTNILMHSDADRGGGWERVRRDCRAGGSLEAAAQSKRYLVPLLLTGVSLHPPAPKGGPTRTSADASVPRLAGFSLITLITYALVSGCHGTLILWHELLGHRRPVEWCEQSDRPVATRARVRGRTGLSDA